MTCFKILAFVLPAIIAIGGLYLTEPNKPGRALFLSILIIIVMFIGIVLEVKDAKSKKQQQDEAVAQNIELSGKIENLNDQNKELIAGKDKVFAQNKVLLEKIENLNGQNKKLIEQNKDYLKDLREKDLKIKELDKKAKMSARNVTSMYDFNGAKRQTSGGKINVVVGEEFGIFQQMIEFAKAEDLPNLIKLCEKQIEKTPDWYTPYFYLGMAQADMGLKDEAIKNIRYVVDNTPGDPDYAGAREILEKLKRR